MLDKERHAGKELDLLHPCKSIHERWGTPVREVPPQGSRGLREDCINVTKCHFDFAR
jgi:hypothetical protein